MMTAVGAVFARELRLAWLGGAGPAAPLGFFAGATALLPLAIGPDPKLLAAIGPSLLWITGALAALITLERLFQADLEDGALDQWMQARAPLELLCFAKAAAAWIAVGAPMALLAAPLALAMQAPMVALPAIALGMAVGMAAFFAAGLFAAALAAGVRRGGVLIAVLMLPFYAPPIIFGAAAAAAAAQGHGAFTPPFYLLCACAAAAMALGPIGAAAVVRLQAE
ncbi:MAG: heme exporter protein CcmB [Hyphomonadaceae bacterium]